MTIGFVGLGKMGAQMVRRLLGAEHTVVVFDVDTAAVERAADQGATPANSYQSLVAALGAQPIIWLMIPAQFVDTTLDTLLPLLPQGSIVIDGGNSDYRRTADRAQRLGAQGVTFMDVGTSGGVLGEAEGFSMMIGGDAATYTIIKPLIASLARPNGYAYLGPSGAGHFVKMVHNGIEYGMMQAYAEGYHVMKQGPYPGLSLADAANVWQHGSIIESKLNELIAGIMANDQELSGIDGVVAESGEARWTVETAKAHHISTPAIETSLTVRLQSQQGKTTYATKLLAALRNAFGGHAINQK